jgi:hypothetical protein
MKQLILKYFQVLIPLALLLTGLYLVPVKIMDTGFTKIIGDLGDARFNNYILEHGHKFLHGEIRNFWNAPMMYPYKNVIAFSDNLLGTMPIYSVFRDLGCDRETAFQCWVLSLFTLNFIFCFITLKKWCGNSIIAATAAYIFAFGIYNTGHFQHIQVLPKFIAPLVVYWSWKFFTTKDIKYFLYSNLGLVFQFYCGIYLGFFLLYALLFLTIAYFIIYLDIKFFNLFLSWKFLLKFLLIILLSAVLLYWLMHPYYEIIKFTDILLFEDIFSSIPKPVSYFFSHTAASNWHILSGHSQFAFPLWWSHFHFVGALPFLGIILVFILFFINKVEIQQKKFLVFLLLVLFLNIIFCLNINGFTLYKYIYLIPGFSSMRSLDRIMNIQIIFFILIFTFAMNEALKINTKMKYLVYLLPLLVIIDNKINVTEIKRFDKAYDQSIIKEIESNISRQYNHKYKSIAYLPLITKPAEPEKHTKTIQLNISAILAAQSLNIPIVNGYSGHYPDKFMAFFDQMDTVSLKTWCDFNKCNINEIQCISDTIINQN